MGLRRFRLIPKGGRDYSFQVCLCLNRKESTVKSPLVVLLSQTEKNPVMTRAPDTTPLRWTHASLGGSRSGHERRIHLK